MKMKNRILIAILVMASMSVSAQKTLFVSTDAVLGQIPQVRIADSLIGLEDSKLAGVYNERKVEIDELVDKFIIDSLTMTATQKEEKRKALQEKYAGLGKLESELKQKLEEFKDRTYQPIRIAMFETIKAVAKAKASATVLYRENAILVPPGTDITEEVIKKMKPLKIKFS
jgi:Skp family chaperone for outer membrane proteins